MNKLVFDIVPIEKIKVRERARKDLGDIEALAEDVAERGILQPLVVDQYFRLLAGERRLTAAKMAGLTEVPVVIKTTTGHIDSLEIELIENTLRKDFTWQERATLERRIYDEKLEKDPNWTQAKQADTQDAAIGAVNRRIQLAEAMELMPELADCETEAEAWKTLSKLEESYATAALLEKVPAEVKSAARWANDHYIVGDAIEGMKKVADKIADFAEVDPPYAVEIIEGRKARNADKTSHGNYHEWPRDSYPAKYGEVATEVFRILKDGTFAVFWFGPTWFAETRDVLREVGFAVPDIPAVWSKGPVGQTASPDTTFGSCYEPFWLARKGNGKMARPGRGNVFNFTPVTPMKKIHATEKPLALLQDIISTITFPGSAILVPFLGSGVTLRAAYSLGHTGWGYDLSEENKNLFLKRVYDDGEASTSDQD